MKLEGNMLFNYIIANEYSELNSDIMRANCDPLLHYKNHGRKENRSYSYIIDEFFIKNAYEKELSGLNGIEYFFNNGNIKPNSWLDLDYIRKNNEVDIENWLDAVEKIYNNEIDKVIPFFDNSYYVENTKKIGIEVTCSPIIHYLREGWKSGIDFHPFFDTWYFIEKNFIQDIEKPYIFYLYEKELYEISPFIDIKYCNHLLRRENINLTKGLYQHIFSEKLKIEYLHPDYKNNILSFIKEKNVESLFGRDNIDSNFNLMQAIFQFSNYECKMFDAYKVDITIIIVNYHKLQLTLLSLLSVLNSDIESTYEIIIFDNECDRFETEILYRYTKKIKNIKIINSKSNLYFGEANNLALEYAHGNYILFLNNDAFVNGNTIEALKEAMSEEIAACAPISINERLEIVEAGGTISDFLDVYQNLRGRILSKDLYKELKSKKQCYCDYASAACLMIKRKFIENYGGFDPIYEPFYYEDTDLCMRITHNKYKILLNTHKFYLHLENTSTKEFLNDNFSGVVERAREKFIQRWKHNNYQTGKLSPQIINARLEWIGIYTPFKINVGGGENYILSILGVLSDNYNVCIITEEFTSKYRIYRIAEMLNIHIRYFQTKKYDEVANRRFKFVVAMGNEIVPQRKFNTDKLFYHCQFPFPLYYTLYHPNSDNNYIYKYICNSYYTKMEILSELYKYKLTNKSIEVIYPPIKTCKDKFENLLNSKNNVISFVTVGRFITKGHRKNQDIILKCLLKISLTHEIYGAIYGGLDYDGESISFYNSLIRNNTSKGIDISANVSNEEIIEAYRKSHYYIHAAGMHMARGVKNSSAEHFGITVVEAMSYGCIPVVYDWGGPKEIVKKHQVGYVYDNELTLYDLLTFLCNNFKNKDYYKSEALRCFECAKQYDTKIFNESVNNIIN